VSPCVPLCPPVSYGKDAEQLLTRPKESYDGAMPSDNSIAALNFLRLFRLTGRVDLKEKALDILNRFSARLTEIPGGHTYMLLSWLYLRAQGRDIVITGTIGEAENMLKIADRAYMPFTEVVFKEISDTELEKLIPFVKDIAPLDNKAAAFICENMACLAPISSSEEFGKLLKRG